MLRKGVLHLLTVYTPFFYFSSYLQPLPSKRILDQTQYVKQLKERVGCLGWGKPKPKRSRLSSAAMGHVRNASGLWDTAWEPLDWKVSQAPFSAEVLWFDHMPGCLLNPGDVILLQPRIILCISNLFYLGPPKTPFSKVVSLLKSVCQSHSQLNVLCALVTGVFILFGACTCH